MERSGCGAHVPNLMHQLRPHSRTCQAGVCMDVMFTCQLSMRMLDRQTSRMDPTHVPPLMEEERVMHSARLLADMPEVPP